MLDVDALIFFWYWFYYWLLASMLQHFVLYRALQQCSITPGQPMESSFVCSTEMGNLIGPFPTNEKSISKYQFLWYHWAQGCPQTSVLYNPKGHWNSALMYVNLLIFSPSELLHSETHSTRLSHFSYCCLFLFIPIHRFQIFITSSTPDTTLISESMMGGSELFCICLWTWAYYIIPVPSPLNPFPVLNMANPRKFLCFKVRYNPTLHNEVCLTWWCCIV